MAQVTRVDELEGSALVDISSLATLRAAAEELTSQQVGALLVVRPNGRRAVLSERDIVISLAEGTDPDEERVGDWCSNDVVATPGDSSLEDALTAMQEAQVRHLVIDCDGGETRVVSMRELVKHLPSGTPA